MTILWSALIGAIFIVAGDRLWEHVKAVTCVNPNVTDAAHGWAAGVTVAVNVSNVPSALQSCIKTAFTNWNNAKTANGSNVTFNVGFDGPKPNLSSQINVYQVTYQQPTDNNGNPANVAANTQDQGRSNGTLGNASTDINPKVTNCTALTQTMAHEIGHTFGLGECPLATCPDQSSVMVGIPCAQTDASGNCTMPDWNNTTRGLSGPTSCDNTTVHNTCYGNGGGGGGGSGGGCDPSTGQNCSNCAQVPLVGGPPGELIVECDPGTSPIIIDTEGEGFHLTSAVSGVTFDISGTGKPVQIAWTDARFNNAFLALPGADGVVHNGKDLFGNFTPQPQSPHPNGFLALAQYDKPDNGGNGDGIIDEHDQVFSQLRLWIDANHDGICQRDELHRLPELGVYSLALNYTESRRIDQFGNQFRYKARVNPGDRRDSRDELPHGETNEVGRWTYDVFFATK